MIDGDVFRPTQDLDQIADATPMNVADIVEYVVLDENPLRLLARVNVVCTQNVHSGGNVAHDIVSERDVPHHGPGRIAVLIPRREEDRIAVLRIGPVVFEDVLFDQNAARILQLKKVLDAPWSAAPRQGFCEGIAADDNVGRDEVGDVRVGAAEHQVLPGTLQIVVENREGSRTVPPQERL